MYVITDKMLRELAPMEAVIAAVRDGFLAYGRGDLLQLPKVSLPQSKTLGYFAEANDGSGTSVKVATVRPENRQLGLPTMHGVVLWHDEHGRPQAIMEATALTALRTGAVAGVATALLAEPDATQLTMFGAGGQAADQIRAVLAVRKIERVQILARSQESSRSLCSRLVEEYPNVLFEASTDPRVAIENADVISCATVAESALFSFADLPDRVHVNSAGNFPAQVRELPPEFVYQADLTVVDDLHAATHEVSDVKAAIAANHLTVDGLVPLAELLKYPEKYPPRGRTLFKSAGLPLQDWVTAKLVFERAQERRDVPTFDLAVSSDR